MFANLLCLAVTIKRCADLNAEIEVICQNVEIEVICQNVSLNRFD